MQSANVLDVPKQTRSEFVSSHSKVQRIKSDVMISIILTELEHQLYHFPEVRQDKYKFSMNLNGTIIWNSLILKKRFLTTLQICKKVLKKQSIHVKI